MGFKTINGKKVFIDDNRRSSGSGHNDESGGMKIGSGTRVPSIEKPIKVITPDGITFQTERDAELIENGAKIVGQPFERIGDELIVKPFDDSQPFDRTGMTFFQGGKAFKVELDPSLGIIAVDERFQDEDGKWQTGKNIFFAQGEEGQDFADDAGGFFIDKIMEHLDSAGALEGAR
jgi:hypothetical protein